MRAELPETGQGTRRSVELVPGFNRIPWDARNRVVFVHEAREVVFVMLTLMGSCLLFGFLLGLWTSGEIGWPREQSAEDRALLQGPPPSRMER